MIPMSRNLIRSVFSSASSAPIPTERVLVNLTFKMDDKFPFKKQKYDGRTKKRQWEERRTDKGEAFNPNPKKTKIDVNEEQVSEKIRRRKCCLLMGYSGVNYFGMQRNPGSQTIEEELLKSLYKVDYICESFFKQVQNMQFQRAARTDKGVSAARQVVSLKLPENIDLSKINSELPDDIRVFAYKRVTKGFNSKSQCDSRTYTYMLPTVAFSHQNEEALQEDYRISEDKFNEVNDILKNYVGTKNYHNFTSKKKPNDPSANRYMKSFVCGKPFVRKGVEFAVLKVQGQSFMLHQIRKMVGLVLAIMRGLTTVETLQKSFKMEKVCIPRAPGLGLVLEYVHYDRYNFRYGESGTHAKLTWEEVEDQVQEFKEKYIYPTIIDTEIKEGSMITWIHHKLSRHSYDETENDSDDDGAVDDEENNEHDCGNSEKTVDSDTVTLENKAESIH